MTVVFFFFFFFFFAFLIDEGIEVRSKYHYKWTMIGPPAKHHLDGV